MDAHSSHILRMAEARAHELHAQAEHSRLVRAAIGERRCLRDRLRAWVVNAVLTPEIEERLLRLTARQATVITAVLRETMWELDLPVNDAALDAAVTRYLRATAGAGRA